MEKLTILLLKDNHLNIRNASHSIGVSHPLRNQLKVLDIRGNLKFQDDKDYPGSVLGPLTSLKILRLDCISGQSLTSGFAHLSNLKELDFSGTKAAIVANRMFGLSYERPILGDNLKAQSEMRRFSK